MRHTTANGPSQRQLRVGEELRHALAAILLRDNVVMHEGTLKTLKRFKDEVREVREGYECGMAFENYDDMRTGDVIECFELVEEIRQL